MTGSEIPLDLRNALAVAKVSNNSTKIQELQNTEPPKLDKEMLPPGSGSSELK